MSDGFKELSKRLNHLENNAKSIGGKNTVPFDELYNRSFMIQHTDNAYSSFDDFVNAGNFGNVTFKEIPDAEWEKWVVASTDFSSWEEMQKSAGESWIARKLGF